MKYTKQDGTCSGNYKHLYSGGAVFEYWLGHRLYRLTIFVVLPSPSLHI
jgi:hypothetical protein